MIADKNSTTNFPLNKDDQHNFYAQFCFDLSTIQEQTESEVTESCNKGGQIQALMQQKLEEIIRINQENLEINESLVQFDDQTNLQVPLQNCPKFIEHITQALKHY